MMAMGVETYEHEIKTIALERSCWLRQPADGRQHCMPTVKHKATKDCTTHTITLQTAVDTIYEIIQQDSAVNVQFSTTCLRHNNHPSKWRINQRLEIEQIT